jgi:predicted TIM-barrel fold metal-dependent hydrolase
MLVIDTHAHIFRHDLQFAANRHYTPNYDATLNEYMQLLDSHAISYGVLVQVSFLGTDNNFIREALHAYPERLRGIAVVEPSISEASLAALAQDGFVGLRLNYIQKEALPDLAAEPWLTLLRRAERLGWQVEVHCPAHALPVLIRPLLESGLNVVVDHFGRPDPRLGIDDPGFDYLLSVASTRKVWVKLSAAYRMDLDLKRKQRDATRSLGQHRLTWLERRNQVERRPGRTGCAGQRRGLDRGQVVGQVNKCVFVQHHMLSQHSVETEAYAALMVVHDERAADPVREAVGGDTVADLDPCDILPDRDDLTRAIRQGDAVFLACRAIGAFQHSLIAEVQ